METHTNPSTNTAVLGTACNATAPTAARRVLPRNLQRIFGQWLLHPRASSPACPADINNDGSVDFGDLIQLISKWGNCPDCPEDINSDGEVNFTDLLQITSTWGPC